MTREELKEHCKKQIEQCKLWAKHRGEEPSGKIYEEHKLILELLEQEPCEDCISRQSLLNRLNNFNKWCKDGRLQGSLFVIDVIKDMPPVTPQPKTGHWIDCDVSDDYSADGYDCSVCGVNVEYATSYCPICGAKMEKNENG